MEQQPKPRWLNILRAILILSWMILLVLINIPIGIGQILYPYRRRVLWTAGIVAIIAFLSIVIFGYHFGWTWTGLSKRTLWDWLDLLFVPIILAIGGYLFTRSQNQSTQAAAERRALDDILQAYLDGMSQLLTDIEQPLHSAQPGDSLSTVARARTLTVLSRLDSGRKRNVLEFLYESRLIDREQALLDESDLFEKRHNIERRHNIISLQQADLREAHLIRANLERTNLERTNLERADLQQAVLSRANLSNADLSNADLSDADLSGADLRGAVLKSANLNGASLDEANLEDAFLDGAELSANLSGANLSNAELMEANLSNALLSGANLSNAQGITNEELEQQTNYLQGATMPNGQKYEDWLKDRESRKEDGENDGSS